MLRGDLRVVGPRDIAGRSALNIIGWSDRHLLAPVRILPQRTPRAQRGFHALPSVFSVHSVAKNIATDLLRMPVVYNPQFFGRSHL